jgi:hypothetical protein
MSLFTIEFLFVPLTSKDDSEGRTVAATELLLTEGVATAAGRGVDAVYGVAAG